MTKAGEDIRKTLEGYKSGALSLEEAVNQIEVLVADREIEKGIGWQDDGGIRIAVFRGRKLLRNGFRGDNECVITYNGNLENVYCDHSLTVNGNVAGDAKSGHSFSCAGFVGGDVKAGHSASCGDVKQNVKAGHSVSCGNIGGNIIAGHGVRCTGKG